MRHSGSPVVDDVSRRWCRQVDRKKEQKVGSPVNDDVSRRWCNQVERKKERKVGFRKPGYPGSRLPRRLSLRGTDRAVNRPGM
ncbi:hypothetical protein NDU88_004357 [Pleurodeles waltl]|uniref:Uncharacterized protein n=1 Tax=Pleurodeles waltl TaxID=8319 RepID=A0AAV7WWB6_PLEWA|nr:hypothetical protein NDU88_004357 [Pleurodeles waltl]